MIVKFLQAGNGDSIILSFNDANQNRNIIIDSGVSATYYNPSSNTFGPLKDEIDRIKQNNEFIDLLILTHIDNDHICGFLTWFENDKSAFKLIKKIWFNSSNLIAKHFEKPENEDLQVKLNIFNSAQTGIKEAIVFEKYLEKFELLNKNVIIEKQKFEENNLKIEILSPTETQLEKLLREYRKIDSSGKTKGKRKDWDIDLKDFIKEEEEKTFKFKEDDKVKNGSSISFILTYNSLKMLFLADSHPSGVIKELRRLGYSEDNPLNINLMKISHHGSKANTNKELLQIVKTNDYILSTDSSGNYHPNKRTIARIINSNRDAIFHFNYEHVRNEIFTKNDKKDFKIVAKVTNELKYEHEA